MQVVTAPNKPVGGERPWVFLAGGITNCLWWQDEVIEMLKIPVKRYDDPPMPNDPVRELCCTVFNPRRRNFPMHDPNAAKEQIKWEFNALNESDVFSMWFSNAESDQPICMYELGRHLARIKRQSRICIGVEPGYRREQDVHIQTGLIYPDLEISTSLGKHVDRIREAIFNNY